MLPGSTYHLFNHANGRENLFLEPKNYDFFLGRLSLHVLPIAHIYAYCLLPNHFHLLLKIRDQQELTTYFHQKDINTESVSDLLPQTTVKQINAECSIKESASLFLICSTVIPRHLIRCMRGEEVCSFRIGSGKR